MSPSLRGSGLKFYSRAYSRPRTSSPSLRGSGLKSGGMCVRYAGVKVSLFTREWIEMSAVPSFSRMFMSPSLRGSGLKCSFSFTVCLWQASPSLRGSGLKYQGLYGTFADVFVSLFTREWIEIKLFPPTSKE